MTDLRSGTPSNAAAEQSPARLHWYTVAPLACAALAMQSAAWLLMIAVAEIARDAYGFFSFSDIAGTYYPYAIRMASGMAAYRDFFIEYPPLFVPLLAAVGKPVSPSDFLVRFAALMVVFMLAAGVVTTLAAVDGRSSLRPYATAAVFSALVPKDNPGTPAQVTLGKGSHVLKVTATDKDGSAGVSRIDFDPTARRWFSIAADYRTICGIRWRWSPNRVDPTRAQQRQPHSGRQPWARAAWTNNMPSATGRPRRRSITRIRLALARSS